MQCHALLDAELCAVHQVCGVRVPKTVGCFNYGMNAVEFWSASALNLKVRFRRQSGFQLIKTG